MTEVEAHHGRGTKVRARRTINDGKLVAGKVYTIDYRRNGWVYLRETPGLGWSTYRFEVAE